MSAAGDRQRAVVTPKAIQGASERRRLAFLALRLPPVRNGGHRHDDEYRGDQERPHHVARSVGPKLAEVVVQIERACESDGHGEYVHVQVLQPHTHVVHVQRAADVDRQDQDESREDERIDDPVPYGLEGLIAEGLAGQYELVVEGERHHAAHPAERGHQFQRSSHTHASHLTVGSLQGLRLQIAAQM